MRAPTITLAGVADVADWRDFLASRLDRPPLGGPEWQQVLAPCYGRDVEALIARTEGTVSGVLSFHVTGRDGVATKLFSSPWGLVADDAAVAQSLAIELKAVARARNCISADISSGTDAYSLPGRHRVRHSFLFDVNRDESTIWSDFRGRTRNAIRKGEKSGLRFVRGWGALADFYKVFSSRMIAKGIPHHRFEYFEALARMLGPQGEIFAAYGSDRIEGAMLVIYGKRTAFYGWGAVDPGAESVRAGQFLLWQIVRQCLARGITRLDLGESALSSGTAHFKMEFGAQPVEIHYYDLLAAPGHAETGGPDAPPPPLSLFGRAERWIMGQLPRAMRSRILQSRRITGRLI